MTVALAATFWWYVNELIKEGKRCEKEGANYF